MMNIYFICTGNTCRSPMAEAILKTMDLPNVQVRSAGIYALEGGEMSENAKTILATEKIAADHVSKQLSMQDVEWADLILTMTTAHKNTILATYPSAHSKTYTLKEYVAPYSSKDISDPFGGNLVRYKQTFDELNNYIEELRSVLIK